MIPKSLIRIGVDFDNTIVCYDKLFYKIALEQGLIPSEIPCSKSQVRDYLRKCDREDDWTELQGYVYGSRMNEANIFDGVADFFIWCKLQSIPVFIVSHKTLYPFIGKKYNLHESAYNWLKINSFFDINSIGLAKENAFFELTQDEKLNRINKIKCTHFIDDLPEFLLRQDFPLEIRKILFDPTENSFFNKCYDIITSWKKIKDRLVSDII